MVTKRGSMLKQQKEQETTDKMLMHLRIGKPIFHLGFYLAEIDKIMKDRYPRYQITRQRRRQLLPTISLDGNGNVLVDNGITKLPEDVVRLILSFMTMREVANASILSREWRYFWRISSNLDFDNLNMTGHDLDPRGFATMENRSKFVAWVNQILELHCGERINSFMVEYPVGRDYGCHIDRWIQFAVEKGVEKLNVNLYEFPLSRYSSETYKFPYWLFAEEGRRSNLKHLSLNGFIFSLPPNFSSFNSLISLTLEYAYLIDDTVENIFTSCVSLKWFSMKVCYCPVRLKVAGALRFLNLMHLSIDNCNKVEEIEVHDAVNFASFEYAGTMLRQLMLKNSAQPVRLVLDIHRNSPAADAYSLGGFVADFPQVETLLLNSAHWMVDTVHMQLPTFTKLKVLVLMLSFSYNPLEMTSFFLETAPFLVKLDLCLPACHIPRDKRMQRKTSRKGFCKHQHLKEVKLHDFHGYQYEFDIAIYLLNNAVLDKMTIVRKIMLYWGNGAWLIPPCKHKVKSKLVRNKLCGKVPYTAKIIVV